MLSLALVTGSIFRLAPTKLLFKTLATDTEAEGSDVTVIEVDLASCADGINVISPEMPVLLDNMLLNIGLDAAPTELVLLTPAGLVFGDPVSGPVGTTAGV